MKKFLLSISALCFYSVVYSQQGNVGINTTTPKGTLDVVGKPLDTSHFDGIIAPRLTGDQLRAKTYTTEQTGALVYVTVADTAPSGQTLDVLGLGYYYFNGTKWVAVASGTSSFSNIYTANGTIPAVNRVVTLADRTASKLTIAPSGEEANISTLNVIGGTGDVSTGITVASNFNNNTAKLSYLKTIPYLNTNPPLILIAGSTSNLSNDVYVGGNVSDSQVSPSNLFFNVDDNLSNTSQLSSINAMTIKGITGNVGIGTSAPEVKLHVKNDIYRQGVLEIDNATDGGFAGIYFTQGGLANYRGHLGYINTGGVPFFGGPGTFQIASGNRPILFSANNGVERFKEIARFDNVTGNFGIATTTPKSTLEVNGLIASGVQVIASDTVISKSYVSFIGGVAQLPRAQDNPGALIFIKNTNSSGVLVVNLPSDGGLIFFANATSGLSSLNMDGAGTSNTKTLLFVSDGTNWTAMGFAN